jgi:hypothetical protein
LGNANTSLMLNWVNAANDAIDAANVARGSYVVRAVFAGDADPNIPLATTGDKQAFANAVLTRIGGGSFLQGAWSEIAANLLLSAGCDPTVNKAAGVPSNLVAGKYTTVDWAITLTNTAATAKTVTVTDTGSTFLSATPSGACTPTTVGGSGPWSCTIPAKANNQNGLVTLNVRTTVPDYNVCTGTSGSNTVTVSGGATGQSTAPFTIAGNPNAPSCLGTIVVHKEIGAGAFATPPATWNFSLSGTGTGTTTIPVAGGQSSFTSLQPGTYTVTETNGATTGCASTSPTGSFWTTHGTATDPSAIGTAESGITVAAGETKHVYFKNTPCAGFLAISKTSSPQDTVAAGGSATWTSRSTRRPRHGRSATRCLRASWSPRPGSRITRRR